MCLQFSPNPKRSERNVVFEIFFQKNVKKDKTDSIYRFIEPSDETMKEIYMNASNYTNPNADCDADEAESDLEAIGFDDALDALPQNVRIGYRTCLCLDTEIGSDFSWCDLTDTDIFERAIKSTILKHRIEEGFSFGLSKEDILRGITTAMSIWSTAEGWAEDLFDEFASDSVEDSERSGFSDCDIDFFVSACADEDEELHGIRMREPLLFSAICVELSRAANRK